MAVKTLGRRFGSFALVAVAAAAAPSSAVAQTQWTDSFETYAAGRFPSTNWSRSGNTTISVSNTVADDGGQSLLLYGLVGQNWAALAHRQYSPAPALRIDFSVRNGFETLTGVHQEYGAVALYTGPSWRNSGRGLILFGMDGKVHAYGTSGGELSGPVLAPFTAGTWYDVSILYQTVSPSTIQLSYWLDGSYRGSFSYAALAAESSLSSLALVSGAGSAWFDKVSIAAVPEPGSAALIGLGGAWLLWRRARGCALRTAAVSG